MTLHEAPRRPDMYNQNFNWGQASSSSPYYPALPFRSLPSHPSARAPDVPRKKARFCLGEPKPKEVERPSVAHLESQRQSRGAWISIPTPFSTFPAKVAKPFIPPVSPFRSTSTGSTIVPNRDESGEESDSSTRSTVTTSAASTTSSMSRRLSPAHSTKQNPVIAASTAPLNPSAASPSHVRQPSHDKPLPTAPISAPLVAPVPLPQTHLPVSLSARTQSVVGESSGKPLYSDSKNEVVPTAVIMTNIRPRQQPIIIRSQTQSFSVMGGLKAVWKKATAHVRQVRREGIAAVISPITERESVLWNGFSKVSEIQQQAQKRQSGIQVQQEGDARSFRSGDSSRSGGSVRSSAWWRAREVAVVGTGHTTDPSTRHGVEIGRSRTRSSDDTSSSSAKSYKTAQESLGSTPS